MNNVPFSSKHFDYDRSGHVFVTDVSILSHLSNGRSFYRIFNDSADEGLCIVSEHTGLEAKYVIDEIVRNADHDIVSWKLLPTTETCKKVPHLKGSSVVVFNT
jgi:hypothetical protein